jgi:hypothetical protein
MMFLMDENGWRMVIEFQWRLCVMVKICVEVEDEEEGSAVYYFSLLFFFYFWLRVSPLPPPLS